MTRVRVPLRSGRLALLLVTALALPCIANAQPEDPTPCPDGQVIGLAYGSNTACVLESGTDTDAFTFFAAPGTTVRFNVLSAADFLDPRIEVFDPNGAPVPLVPSSCNDGTFGGTCSFSTAFQPAVSGLYTLIASEVGTNEAGPYRLSLNCLVGSCDSDGDGLPDASPPLLSYDTPETGAMDLGVDMDPFEFHGAAGTLVRFNVLSATDFLDPAIELFDPNGAPVALVPSSCNDGTFGGTCSFSTEIELTLDGTYTMFVSEVAVNEVGSYQLSLNCLVGSCDSDGDGLPDASPPLLSYDTPETGAMDLGVDMDPFEFHGAAGTLVRFNVLSAADFLDPAIELFDPNGAPVALVPSSCNDGTFGGTCSFSTEIELTLDGTYTMFVSEVAVNEVGSYQLSLNCLVGPCDSDGDGTSDPSAPALVYDSPQSTTLDLGVDMDPFAFHGTPGTLIRFNVLSATDFLDPALDVFGPDGAVVALAPASCNDGTFGGTCSFSTDALLTLDGTYTVFVSDLGVNEGGTYRLSVNCLVGSCDSDVDGLLDPVPPVLAYGAPSLTLPISLGVDMDPLMFGGTTGTRIRFNVLSLTDFLDPRIEIYDPNGAVVAAVPASCDDGTFGGTCSFSTDLLLSSSGNYTAFLYDSGVNESGSIQISLTCLVGNCLDATPVPVCAGGVTLGCRDNCYAVANADQADAGGVGLRSLPDAIGDVCQCGDANNDKFVTGLDGTLIKRAALNLAPFPNGPADLPGFDKCSVDAIEACAGLDGTLVTRASLGLPPGVQQTCRAATGTLILP